MNTTDRAFARADLRFRVCPDCNAGFPNPAFQRFHAEEIGHTTVRDCKVTHPRTRRHCERYAAHAGSHGYIGAQMAIYWQD